MTTKAQQKLNMKLKHWRANPGKNALEPAPVLAFRLQSEE